MSQYESCLWLAIKRLDQQTAVEPALLPLQVDETLSYYRPFHGISCSTTSVPSGAGRAGIFTA
jgi:hypothetical protein